MDFFYEYPSVDFMETRQVMNEVQSERLNLSVALTEFYWTTRDVCDKDYLAHNPEMEERYFKELGKITSIVKKYHGTRIINDIEHTNIFVFIDTCNILRIAVHSENPSISINDAHNSLLSIRRQLDSPLERNIKHGNPVNAEV